MKICPQCGGRSGIYDARLHDDGCMHRRHKCKDCDARWTTVELSMTEYDRLIEAGKKLKMLANIISAIQEGKI